MASAIPCAIVPAHPCAYPHRPARLRLSMAVVYCALVPRPERDAGGSGPDADGRRAGTVPSRAALPCTDGCSPQSVARYAVGRARSNVPETSSAAPGARRRRCCVARLGSRAGDAAVAGAAVMDPRRPSPRESAGGTGTSCGCNRLWRHGGRRSGHRLIGDVDVAAGDCAIGLLELGTRTVRRMQRTYVHACTCLGPGIGTFVVVQFRKRCGNARHRADCNRGRVE